VAKIILRLLCIASGSGTDFKSIAKAYRERQLVNDFFEVQVVGLVSTVAGAYCLERAKIHKIPEYTVDRQSHDKLISFKNEMFRFFQDINPDFIFLVGCKHLVPVYKEWPTFNIHPADKEKHGGHKMFGLDPHIHVLKEIMDKIQRKKADYHDRFFTYPTIHEVDLSAVVDIKKEYDGGAEILRGQVEIPNEIIFDCCRNNLAIEKAAEVLQQHVLPFEWQMLPTGVMWAARKILLSRGVKL